MASLYIGCDLPGRKIDVATGASTTSKKVELVIDLATIKRKEEVVRLVECIMQKLQQDTTNFNTN